MSTNGENPFLDRNKVTDPNLFFGRDKELKYIQDRIGYREPQSVAIIGERRIGKSSLLTHLQYSLLSTEKKIGDETTNGKTPRLVSILLDPEEIATDHPEDITWSIIDELVSEEPNLLKYVQNYPDKSDKKRLPKRGSRIVLKNLLKDACKEGYRFVLLIDEFELLAENKELRKTRYLQYLRGLADNYKLAFVTSSRKELKDISYSLVSDGLDKETSPFDNNFSQSVHLGLLEENECVNLINIPLLNLDSNKQFGPSEIEEIIALAGKHPYFLKIAAAHLFDCKEKRILEENLWKREFKKEAAEEFERMWQALGEGENGKENQEWILVVQHNSYINKQEMNVDKELESLYKRGIFRSTRYKGKEDGEMLELFSDGFSEYIKEYVERLENRYSEIEQRIRNDHINLAPEKLEEIRGEIFRLKTAWDSRNKKTGQIDETSIRCNRLFTILSHVLYLYGEIKESRTEPNERGQTGKDLSSEAEDAIIKLAKDYEQIDWFNIEHLKYHTESCKNCIDAVAGKKILDSVVDYLHDNKLDEKFGNGFDKLLAVRIEFMKQYEPNKYFPEFKRQLTDAFCRLAKAHDHARIAEILQIKQNQNLLMKWLTEKYFERPELIIGAIVLLPFIFANFIISVCYKMTSLDMTNPLNKILVSIIWAVAFLVQVYFLLQMYKPLLSKKYSNSTKELFRNETQWKCYGWTAVGYLAIVFVVIPKLPQGFFKEIMESPYYVLSGSALIGLAGLLFRTWKIYPKVRNVSVAWHRATYFCSVTYLKAFWLILLLSELSYLLTQIIHSWTSVDLMSIVNSYQYNYPLGYIFPYVIKIGEWSLIFPLVLALSFVSPIIGVLTGCPVKFPPRENSN